MGTGGAGTFELRTGPNGRVWIFSIRPLSISRKNRRIPGHQEPFLREEGNHVGIYFSCPGLEPGGSQHGYNPYAVFHPWTAYPEGFPQDSPSPASDYGRPLALANGRPQAGKTFAGIQKQQPHQLTFNASAGAEDKIKLPSLFQSKARWEPERMTHLDCEAFTPLASPVADDATPRRGARTHEKSHCPLAARFMGLKGPLH